MLTLAAALGAGIGLILGLTGAGGGILAVPALTLALGWSMTQAAPVALLAVSSAAVIGLVDGFRQGLVRYRAATLISLTGIIATPLGQHYARVLPEPWLAGLFIIAMAAVAVRLWLSADTARDGNDTGERVRRIRLDAGRIIWNRTSFLTLALIGVLTGLSSGLLGVGGGFIIVPALLRCSNITLEGIVATSLMVIALVSGGAFMSAWASGQVLVLDSAVVFVGAAILGVLPGRLLAARLPRPLLLRLFAALVAAVSLLMLYGKVL